MQFSEDKTSAQYVITEYLSDAVMINGETYQDSLIISNNQLILDVPIHSVTELEPSSLSQVIELLPEVLLLGTGEKIEFPHPTIAAYLSQHRIGLETMDHSAACRTFNILAAEGRQVCALLLM